VSSASFSGVVMPVDIIAGAAASGIAAGEFEQALAARSAYGR
jgi:hypothetical protein